MSYPEDIKSGIDHSKLIARLNARQRHREDVPPLFWIAVFIVACLLMIDDVWADARQSKLAVDCIAINVFHEGANEPENGKLAIAFVTVNRMKEQNDDACTVVFKYKQFSWANKALDSSGKLKPEYIPKGAKWLRSREIALTVLNGGVRDFTRGANHYHADYIPAPAWSRGMEFVGKWGAHLFYKGVRRMKDDV